MDDLDGLTGSSVCLLVEFFESIRPLAERAKPLDEDARHAFYIDILPLLIQHFRSYGVSEPHHSALLIVDIIERARRDSTSAIRH